MPVDLIVFSITVLYCYEHKQVVYGPFVLNIREVDSCRICPVSMNVYELDLRA